MANDLKGEVAIKALGKTYKASLPFKVAKALKREHDIDLLSQGEDIGNIDKFEIVLTAMLAHHKPDITEEEVENILTELGMTPAFEAIQPALSAFMGKDIKAVIVPGDEAEGAARPQ